MKLLIGIALLTLASTAALADDPAIRCEFGKGECRARIGLCPPTDTECRAPLLVDCVGYEDGYLTRSSKDGVLFQGITSLKNPSPPAIMIEADDAGVERGQAVLFTSGGLLRGICKEGNDS